LESRPVRVEKGRRCERRPALSPQRGEPALFPEPLPETLGRAAFVAFDKDWRPRLLDPGWRRPPGSQAREYLAWRVMKII